MTTPPAGHEDELVARLRARDDVAFAALVDRYYQSLLHVARGYVATREAAEDVVQDTFLGVIRGIDTFEGRSSVKTWMFSILVNRARTRGERDGRIRPFSSVGNPGDPSDPGGPTVDPDRFEKVGRWAGGWTTPPPSRELPEAHTLATEMGARLMEAIASLPAAQRAVLELRDVQGFGASEVCELLDISEANQRVLLHRARARARNLLEDYIR